MRDDAGIVALNRKTTVEVVPELGSNHQPVAANDEGDPVGGISVAEMLEDAAQDDRTGLVGSPSGPLIPMNPPFSRR